MFECCCLRCRLSGCRHRRLDSRMESMKHSLQILRSIRGLFFSGAGWSPADVTMNLANIIMQHELLEGLLCALKYLKHFITIRKSFGYICVHNRFEMV